MREAEVSGIALVVVGAFNPAIVHPKWLSGKGLITDAAAELAASESSPQQLVASPQLSMFTADWLSVQITQGQAVFSTIEFAREPDLRDFARGVFELLPETPVAALGINTDAHYRMADEAEWHAFGDRYLPKDLWEPIFAGDEWKSRSDGQHVGMRSVAVEAARTDASHPGYVRIELAPSVRVVPFGLYIGINAHYQLSKDGELSNAGHARQILLEEWDSARELETRLFDQLLETAL